MNQLDLYIEEAVINEDKNTSELQLIAELNKMDSSEINHTVVDEELKRVETKAAETIGVEPVSTYPSADYNYSGCNGYNANTAVSKAAAYLSGSDATNWILWLIAFLLFLILCNMKSE